MKVGIIDHSLIDFALRNRRDVYDDLKGLANIAFPNERPDFSIPKVMAFLRVKVINPYCQARSLFPLSDPSFGEVLERVKDYEDDRVVVAPYRNDVGNWEEMQYNLGMEIRVTCKREL